MFIYPEKTLRRNNICHCVIAQCLYKNFSHLKLIYNVRLCQKSAYSAHVTLPNSQTKHYLMMP